MKHGELFISRFFFFVPPKASRCTRYLFDTLGSRLGQKAAGELHSLGCMCAERFVNLEMMMAGAASAW